MGELLEYSDSLGLLVHNPLLALIIVLLCVWLFWLRPELGVALFVLRPQLLYNTEFTSGFFGYRLSLDHILMLVLAVRLWTLYVSRKEVVNALASDPIIKYSLLLTGWILVQPVFRQGWGAHLLVFRQIQNYAIPVFGILIFSTYKGKLRRFIDGSFAVLATLQFVFMLKVLPLVVQGESISRNISVYGIPIWGSMGCYAIIFALVYWLTPTSRRPSGWLCGAVILAGLLTTVLGQARNMWIGTLVTVAFVLAHSGRVVRWLSNVVIASALGLFVLSLVFPVSVENVQRVVLDVFRLRYEALLGPEPLSGRESYWVNAIHSFVRSPIWGVGYDQAAGEYVAVRDGQLISTRPSVHNYFLGILSEEGLVGFALLLAVLRRLAVVLKDNLRAPADSPQIRRWQLLAAALTVYAFTTLEVSYWAAALALVTHEAVAAKRDATALSAIRISRLHSASSPPGAESKNSVLQSVTLRLYSNRYHGGA